MRNNINITIGIERLSTAFRAALWDEAKQYGLSPLQVQILFFIPSHTPKQNSVSALAKEFAVTKATISDAVRVMVEKKILIKVSSDDARAFSLSLTQTGHEQVQKLQTFANSFDEVLSSIPSAEYSKIWEGLLLLITHLQKKSIIPLRACFNCQNYSKNKGAAYCLLLQQILHLEDIRLDCIDHKLIDLKHP